jgi:hypothetical protein
MRVILVIALVCLICIGFFAQDASARTRVMKVRKGVNDLASIHGGAGGTEFESALPERLRRKIAATDNSEMLAYRPKPEEAVTQSEIIEFQGGGRDDDYHPQPLPPAVAGNGDEDFHPMPDPPATDDDDDTDDYIPQPDPPALAKRKKSLSDRHEVEQYRPKSEEAVTQPEIIEFQGGGDDYHPQPLPPPATAGDDDDDTDDFFPQPDPPALVKRRNALQDRQEVKQYKPKGEETVTQSETILFQGGGSNDDYHPQPDPPQAIKKSRSVESLKKQLEHTRRHKL